VTLSTHVGVETDSVLPTATVIGLLQHKFDEKVAVRHGLTYVNVPFAAADKAIVGVELVYI
jgi:hypothetical protein